MLLLDWSSMLPICLKNKISHYFISIRGGRPTMAENLNFQEFPLMNGLFVVPNQSLIVYRSSTTNPITVNEPRFFSGIDNAMLYMGRYANQVWQCTLKPGTRLIDFRTMRTLILEDFLHHHERYSDVEKITQIMTALGLLSHQEQYKSVTGLLPGHFNAYQNNRSAPLTMYGSRLSWHPWDDDFCKLLKQKWKFADGYISPMLPLPRGASSSHFHEEICLFNPQASLINPRLVTNTNFIHRSVRLRNIIEGNIVGFKYELDIPLLPDKMVMGGCKPIPKVCRARKSSKMNSK